MQEKYFYEYAVIRFVPKVEREEFLNVGIILFCKSAQFIQVLFHLDEQRINYFAPGMDLDQLAENLQSFETISKGAKEGGPIAKYEISSRFRWLTATRSSAIQTSKPHPGVCNDLEKTAQRLFEELVL